MPTSLKTFLAATANCFRADCFAIELPTGGTLYATTGQWDITFPVGTPGWAGPTTTFKATTYGVWTRGKITSEATTKCSANTMSLSCVPRQDTNYPGLSIGILNAALNHLFDAATVYVFTAYMPLGNYGNVSAGIETKFQGTITRTPGLSRNKVDFECADPMYLLAMKVPSRLAQANCGWSFADENCTLLPANFTATVTAGTGSNQTKITGATQPDGYFTQGVAKCLTGNNAGLSQTVKAYASGTITLMAGWLLPVAVGDTFAVIRGCDHTPTTCAATTRVDGSPEPQDYRVRFGGTPFVPTPSAAV